MSGKIGNKEPGSEEMGRGGSGNKRAGVDKSILRGQKREWEEERRGQRVELYCGRN